MQLRRWTCHRTPSRLPLSCVSGFLVSTTLLLTQPTSPSGQGTRRTLQHTCQARNSCTVHRIFHSNQCQQGTCAVCAGGGETVEDVAQRLKVLLSRIENSHEDRNVLLVSHGDTLSIFAAVALGLDLKRNRRYGLDTGQLLQLSELSEVIVGA